MRRRSRDGATDEMENVVGTGTNGVDVVGPGEFAGDCNAQVFVVTNCGSGLSIDKVFDGRRRSETETD